MMAKNSDMRKPCFSAFEATTMDDSDRPKHLAHLFASNIPPQSIEIPSIEHAIEESTNAIEELQQRLEKLEHQRQGYRSLLSTVRRLPPEVLGEIFSSFLDIVKRRKEVRRQESLCAIDQSLPGLQNLA
jgi:hypothetical protein